MDEKYNKLISFIIAISVYVLLILLILLYLKEPKAKKYNIKKKETFVQINLITSDDKSIIKEKTSKNKKVLKNKINKASNNNKTKTNLKSLFAKVKVDSNKFTKKELLNTKTDTKKGRFKSKSTTNTKNNNIKISKLKNVNKASVKNINNKSGDEKEDNYFSKIKELILNRWYENPIYTDDDYLVKVYVTIDNKGNFNFNIIKYSKIIEIDNLLVKFLKEQRDIKYPVAKDNKQKTILINFKSEDI
jgi:hypothetical protein